MLFELECDLSLFVAKNFKVNFYAESLRLGLQQSHSYQQFIVRISILTGLIQWGMENSNPSSDQYC
uniref:Uncharacterized protein n=1 Tax=Kalanchoe fedtschenkoi TaxID=63787 RepID=A0A7N0U927_KALFE